MHDAGEKKNELDDQDQHDDELQELATCHRRLLDGEAVDVSQCAQLLLHAVLPLIESQARGRNREEACGVDVADDLEGVFGSVGQLGNIDEQRVNLPYGSRPTQLESHPWRCSCG